MNTVKIILIFIALFFIIRWGIIGIVTLIKAISSKCETIIGPTGDKRYRKEAFVRLDGLADVAVSVLAAIVAGVITILIAR